MSDEDVKLIRADFIISSMSESGVLSLNEENLGAAGCLLIVFIYI